MISPGEYHHMRNSVYDYGVFIFFEVAGIIVKIISQRGENRISRVLDRTLYEL